MRVHCLWQWAGPINPAGEINHSDVRCVQIMRMFLILALAISSQIGAHGASAQSNVVYLPIILKYYDYYYIDSIGGSDSNPGTSADRPWQTFAPLDTRPLRPGGVVYFKRGSSWTGRLVIHNSGEADRPITFTTYGEGNRPIIRNPGGAGNRTQAVVVNASWVVVEGLLVQDAQQAGIWISKGANNNIIRDNEVTNVGLGIAIEGQHNLVTRNYVHDLHMVVNTPGGTDDFGAVGVDILNSYNEVSYNTLVNCIADSYDFGVDGGAFELYDTANSNYIHHNWAADSAGFVEVGGGSAQGDTLAYNVSVDNGLFSWIHLSGTYASSVKNFRVENNTIVETPNDHQNWTVFGFRGQPTASTFLVRNNILHINGLSTVSNTSSFTHDHNLYYLSGGTVLGFSLGSGEAVADPRFVGLAERDFHLQDQSPAIDAGVDLGYTLDFEDHPVPSGAAQDLGAFEY